MVVKLLCVLAGLRHASCSKSLFDRPIDQLIFRHFFERGIYRFSDRVLIELLLRKGLLQLPFSLRLLSKFRQRQPRGIFFIVQIFIFFQFFNDVGHDIGIGPRLFQKPLANSATDRGLAARSRTARCIVRSRARVTSFTIRSSSFIGFLRDRHITLQFNLYALRGERRQAGGPMYTKL